MSVGAGSIKRAARTASEGNKAAVITGAEAEVTEAVVDGREKNVETEIAPEGREKAVTATGRKGKAGKAADGKEKGVEAVASGKEKAEGKATSRKSKPAEKEPSEKKSTAKRAEAALGESAEQVSGRRGTKVKTSARKPETEGAGASPSEVAVPEEADTYVAYGIGQQLPVYLL